MRLRFLAGAASALALVSGAAAYAQGVSTTVTLPDGTVITTTFNGATGTVDYDGPDIDIFANITSLTFTATGIAYSGNVSVDGGPATSFSCEVNTATGATSGGEYCESLFGGASTGGGGGGGGGGGAIGATPGTFGGGAITTTAGPGGSTIYTLNNPDGSSVVVSLGQANLFNTVQYEQFLLSLAADIKTIDDIQSVVVSRFSQMQALGLAPGNISLTSAATYRGRSAGPGGSTPFFWIDGSASHVEDDRIGAGVDGRSQSLTIGGDLSAEGWALGAFLTYGDTDLAGLDAVVETDGLVGALYGRWSLTPGIRLTGVAGVGSHDVYFARTVGGLTSTGSTERDLEFALISAETQFDLGQRILVTPSFSVIYSGSETDPYTDSNGFPIGGVKTDTTLGSLGGAFYLTGGQIVPYLTLNVNHAFDDQPGVDSSYGTVGAGLITSLGEGVALVAGVNALVSKSGEQNTGVSVSLRRGF